MRARTEQRGERGEKGGGGAPARPIATTPTPPPPLGNPGEDHPTGQQQSWRSTVTDYGISLAPWAGYVAFTNALGSWRDGFIVGLAMSALLVVVRTVKHDSRFLDTGTLAYCAAMAAISTIDPGSPIRAYNLPLSMSAVGGLSSASLAIKSPFTYRIAREHVPKKVLEDPERHRILYRAHAVATSWWAVSQLAAAGASALLLLENEAAAAIAVQAVGTLIPVAVTRFQHERVAKDFEDTDAVAPGNHPPEGHAPGNHPPEGHPPEGHHPGSHEPAHDDPGPAPAQEEPEVPPPPGRSLAEES